MLPILHLNGYKISGATVLGRTEDADVCALLASQGWDPVGSVNPSQAPRPSGPSMTTVTGLKRLQRRRVDGWTGRHRASSRRRRPAMTDWTWNLGTRLSVSTMHTADYRGSGRMEHD